MLQVWHGRTPCTSLGHNYIGHNYLQVWHGRVPCTSQLRASLHTMTPPVDSRKQHSPTTSCRARLRCPSPPSTQAVVSLCRPRCACGPILLPFLPSIPASLRIPLSTPSLHPSASQCHLCRCASVSHTGRQVYAGVSHIRLNPCITVAGGMTVSDLAYYR